MFGILKRFKLLRVSEEIEVKGLPTWWYLENLHYIYIEKLI